MEQIIKASEVRPGDVLLDDGSTWHGDGKPEGVVTNAEVQGLIGTDITLIRIETNRGEWYLAHEATVRKHVEEEW